MPGPHCSLFSKRRESAEIKNRKNQKPFLWILKVMGGTKWIVLFLIFCTMIQSSGFVINALFLKGIVDGASAHDTGKFYLYSTLFTATAAFLVLLRAVINWLYEYSCAVTENRFKKRLFTSLLYKDYASVTSVHTGEWINRLTSDTVVVSDNIATLFPWLAGMIVQITGALIVIYSILPWLGAVVLIGGFFLILITASFKFIFKKLHKQIREADGNLRIFLSERLGNLLVVRLFDRKQINEDEFEIMADAHKKRRMERVLFSNICGILLGTLRSSAYIIGIFVCGLGILNGTISYGTFAAVTKLVLQIQFPFSSIIGYIPKYFSMLASAERLMEAEDFADDFPIEEQISPKEINSFYQNDFSSLGLRNAFFSYKPPVETKETMPVVLDSFDLEINKGDCIAFMGPSGCGKSTVLKILMGFYTLNSGELFLKSKEKEERLTPNWRGLFAYVPQGNQLINDTIRNVISMGVPESEINDEKINRALKIACADEFVENLNEGIDTLLGERGSGLSEGQKQRIAIARAIFIDRPIILLDEATSALDEATETRLLKNLKGITNKTIIIVTHRLSVLTICSKQLEFTKRD